MGKNAGERVILREEKRLADEAKAKKADEANKELETNLANFKGKAVGVNSIDTVSQELATSSAQEFAKNARVQTDPKATQQEKDRARLANFQIKRQFENSQAYMQMILDKKNEIEEEKIEEIEEKIEEEIEEEIEEIQEENNILELYEEVKKLEKEKKEFKKDKMDSCYLIKTHLINRNKFNESKERLLKLKEFYQKF